MQQRPTLQLLLAALLFWTSSCVFTAGGTSDTDGSLDPPGILEVRFQVDSLGPETHVLSDAEHGDVLLGQPYLFGLARVSAASDDFGRPALAFEITKADAQAFSDLTAAHVGEAMALIVQKEVVSLTTIHSRLPGSAQIYGDFTEEYVSDLIAKLKAAR